MRKVKFTQDLFDMKLGGILSEFPILDVSQLKRLVYLACPQDIEPTSFGPSIEPPPLPVLPPQRPVRQEPLQARPRSIEHGEALDRPGRQGLRQVVEVWR